MTDRDDFLPEKVLEVARRVVDIEAQSVTSLSARLGEEFVRACRFLHGCGGHIILIGIGKSGFIANKIASTLASTGSPAFFIHATEASHGDLGMIASDDVAVLLSNSGETVEVTKLLPILKRRGVTTIALCGNPDSTLANNVDVCLDLSVPEEACPLNLAPTASTTVSLVMGDALALALLDARGFTSEEFARNHPGGRLGRRLLLQVDDIMHRGTEVPGVDLDTALPDVLCEMSAKRMGMTLVLDKKGAMAGVFTDGDLRRVLDSGVDLKNTQVCEVMTKNCRTILVGTLAVDALKIMEQESINALPVVDSNGSPLGALNIHDLLRAGL